MIGLKRASIGATVVIFAILASPFFAFGEGLSEAEIYYAKGRIKFYDEEYEEAAELFAKALKLSPDRSDISQALGFARMQTGSYEDAVSALEKAHRAEPDNLRLTFDLSMAYYEVGKFSEAKELLAKAIERDAKAAEYHYYLGLSLFRLGENEEALKELSLAHELDKSFTQVALYYKGFVYKNLEKEGDAKVAWEMAIEADPKSEIASAAKDAISAKEIEGAVSEQEIYPRFLFSASIGAQYDSNALLVPDKESDYLEVFQSYADGDKIDKDDFQGALSLSGTVNPYITETHLIGLTASGNANYHLTEEIRTLNYTSGGGGAQYEYLKDEFLLRIPARIRVAFLGDSFDYYSLSYWGSPSFYYLWSELTLTKLLLNGGYSQFGGTSDYSDRTGLFANPELGQYFQFLQNRLVFGLNYRFNYLDAKGNDWGHFGNGGYFTFTFKAPANIIFNLFGGAVLRNFRNVPENPYATSTEKRKDVFFTGGGEIFLYFSRDEWDRGLYISASGNYSNNISSEPFYEYTRIVAGLNFGANL
ncbi:MAG: hypothetical protein Kow0090_16000 [Myxococcota bacterium]